MSKSLKTTSGIKVNIGTKSVSTTIGTRNISTNIGTKGTSLNLRIPNTGIKIRVKLSKKGRKRKYARTKSLHNKNSNEIIIQGAVTLGAIIGGIIFLMGGSLSWSLLPVFIMPVLCMLNNKNSHKN